MTAGRSTDAISGSAPNLRWPVYTWRSSSVHNAAPQKLAVASPIPPTAAVTMTNENLVADLGYSVKDEQWGFRERIVGANSFIHPFWDDSVKTIQLISGNAANAYFYPNKSTGAGTAATSARWNQRVYGYWTDRGNSFGSFNGGRDRRASLSTQNAQGIRILRKKWFGPWEPLAASPQIKSYDLKQYGHNDTPAFIELWFRCYSSDGAFQTDDEACFYPDDIGSAASTGLSVWHNGSTVGYTMPSGLGVLDPTGAVVDLACGKWHVQMRVVFAGEPDDLIDPRQAGRNQIGMHYTRWQVMAASNVYTFPLPDGFRPVGVFPAARCRVGTSTAGGYNQGDQYYSRSAGQASNAAFPTALFRGGRLLIPLGPSATMMDQGGGGAGATINTDFDVQFRLIG